MRLMLLRIASDPIRKPRNSFIVVLYRSAKARASAAGRLEAAARCPAVSYESTAWVWDEIEPSRCPRALRRRMRVRHIPAQPQFDA